MKKILLMACALGMTMSLSAQEQTYRKSWNFTKWSSETVANLQSHADWTDDEKGDGTSNVTGDKCLWQTNALASAVDENGYLLANGTVIAETKGLVFTVLNAKTAAIALDYGTTTDSNKWGPYNGGQYFWPAGASSKITFGIPGVNKGTTIKMGIESHKPSDGRGVDLYVGSTQLELISGQSSCRPTTYDEFEWQVPEDLESEGDIVTVDVKPSNGCHIYYITVGDGDGDVVEEAKKMAYVTVDESEPLAELFDGASIEKIFIDPANADITLADLQEYEGVIVSPSVPADAAIVPVLKSAIAYVPMLNLNAELYPVWNLGQQTVTEEQVVTVAEAYAEDEIFSLLVDNSLFMGDATVSALELGDYFKNDEVIATVGDNVAIHRHNAGRNAYVNVPYNSALDLPNMEIGEFFTNLALNVAASKRNVTAVAAPTFTQTNENLFTEVTISDAAEGATIYYTIDGTEPTADSKVYEGETLTFTEAAVVKAFATLDGYLDSKVTEAEVVIYSKVSNPEVALAYGETSTTVTLSCPTADSEIYFSFQKFTNPAMAQKYTEPFTLSQEPSEIYVMATAPDCVNSELVEDYVAIKSLTAETIRLDVVSHFQSLQDAWAPAADRTDLHEKFENKSSADYFTGRSGLALEETYVYLPNEGNGMANDWKITTKGQVICTTYKDAPQNGVSDGTAAGRYADEAIDLIGFSNFTKGYAQFGAVAKDADGNSLDNSAAVESAIGFDAPFDVVVIAGNNKGGELTGEIQTSTDGVNWEKLADLRISPLQRYIKKTRVSVEGTGKVYVRVANTKQNVNIYDIFIYNNGEESKKYVAPEQSGIEDIAGDAVEAEVVRTEIYGINGMLLPELTNGINIVRTYYSDGTVKTAKVAVRK